jgi:hypothetical protein
MASTNESWSISYTLRDGASNDVRSIVMSWERQTPAQIIQNLNSFLVAAGAPLKVVASE